MEDHDTIDGEVRKADFANEADEMELNNRKKLYAGLEDLESPTRFASILDESMRLQFLDQKLVPELLVNGSDSEESSVNSYASYVKNGGDNSASTVDVTDGQRLAKSETKTKETKLESSPLKSDLRKSPFSMEEIAEEVIVPLWTSGDKGAFITKMDDDGGVEFEERLLSADFSSSLDDDAKRTTLPIVLHVARAVATPTSITVGACDTKETPAIPKRMDDVDRATTSSVDSDPFSGSVEFRPSTAETLPKEPKRPWSSSVPERTPVSAPDSGILTATGVAPNGISNPWQFPQSHSPSNLNRHHRHQTSSQSSGTTTSSVFSSASSSSLNENGPKDVMISYSHTDRDIMKRIKAKLEEAGISVWVDSTGLRSGVDFLSKIGQAIIDAKLFVSLVSPKSLKSKFCRDELSLAYISDKFLFPVALRPLDTLVRDMDTGLKLVLTRLEWTLFYEDDKLEDRMNDLVHRMRKRLEQKATEPSVDSLSVPRRERTSVPAVSHLTPPSLSPGADRRRESFLSMSRSRRSRKKSPRQCLNRQHSMYRPALTPQHDSSDSSSRESLGVCSISLTPSLEENTSILFFWERNFDAAESVPWSRFEGEFRRQYGDELNNAYTDDEQRWMLEILYKELVDDEDDGTDDENDEGSRRSRRHTVDAPTRTPLRDKLVLKSKYEDYCRVDGEMYPFWVRLQNQAVEKLAMKAVFSMESEPAYRLKAIENLSTFKSTAVVDALIELLWDKDPNVRAIAAISVAKCGVDIAARRSEGDAPTQSFEEVDDWLIEMLKDKDRLVRESACIALGHRRCQKVVPTLCHLWRNDTISSVREAAQLALEKIGGAEASRAIHMTKILQEEMKTLMDGY